MKFLIVNADDFGLSKSVNRGIIDCFHNGIVRSTTLMANMPGFSDAVLSAKNISELGVGAHLNIYRGGPVSPVSEIQSLVNDKGEFLASLELAKRIYFKEVKVREVENEFRAQIFKIQDSGIKISHLDSEKHFHAFPIIARAMVRVALEFKINKIRLPRERIQEIELKNLASPQFYKLLYLRFRAEKLGNLFRKNGIRMVDNFFGILYSGEISVGSFSRLLERIPEGYSELMVHPGYVDAELRMLAEKYNNYLLEEREKEQKILTSSEVKQKIEELGIKLINYNEF